MKLLLFDAIKGHVWFAKISGVVHGANLDNDHFIHARGSAGQRGATVLTERPYHTIFKIAALEGLGLSLGIVETTSGHSDHDIG